MERFFQARITGMDDFIPSTVFKAFDYPRTPVITRDDPELIQGFQWGMIPTWADAGWNRNYTLNARVETLGEKPSFRDSTDNRCLIVVNGFYEWQHIGKVKRKYEIGFSDSLFALAGLYTYYEDQGTYTVVTTEAQGVMREIHNTKLRMPYALKTRQHMVDWLSGQMPEPDCDFTTLPELLTQTRLF